MDRPAPMSLKTSPIANLASNEVARHIANVAARMFATRGYDATSVRDIVEAAEIAKPTLYYYFGSKQGLAEALLTMPMTQLLEAVERVVASEATAAESGRKSSRPILPFAARMPIGRGLCTRCFLVQPERRCRPNWPNMAKRCTR